MGNIDRVAQNFDGADPLPSRQKRTPDFTHLLRRDLTDYLIGRGFPRPEARKRAAELLELVEREARKFT